MPKQPNFPDGMTMRQVADRLGISYQRVQQIEAKALRRLRGALLRSGITEADALEAIREMTQRHK